MALARQLGVVLLILVGTARPEFTGKYFFTTQTYASFPTMREAGYMFDPNSDGCRALDPPPSSGPWFVILANYSNCTVDKIRHAREVDYRALLTYGDNRNITDEVRNEGYPIIVISRERGRDLKGYAVDAHGGYYVTITPETSQTLRIEVSTDSNGDMCYNTSFTTLVTCLVAVSIFAIA
jgi:hypothetical protein